MKTGLTKRQKTTCIYFDEASKSVEIQTHNTALKKRLTQYAARIPTCAGRPTMTNRVFDFRDRPQTIRCSPDCAVFGRASAGGK